VFWGVKFDLLVYIGTHGERFGLVQFSWLVLNLGWLR
jgi:hypothetical protein